MDSIEVLFATVTRFSPSKITKISTNCQKIRLLTAKFSYFKQVIIVVMFVPDRTFVNSKVFLF